MARAHILLCGVVLSAINAIAQPVPALQCTFNSAVTPTIRVEGLTESIGDVVVVCTGGTPTTPGGTVSRADIRIFVNTNLTSRIVSPGFSEALLMIDEPHSASNPSVPFLPCGAATSGDDGTGVCPIIAGATPNVTYNGTPGHPNVFQGQPDGVNAVVFKGVPIDPPAAQSTRVFRITNLRANANQLGVSGTFIPSQVVAYISPNPPNYLPLNNPQQTLAFITNGLLSGGITQSGSTYSVKLSEGFPGSWRERNIQVHLSNTGLSSPFAAPSDSAQDVPGANYFSESGFLVNGVAVAGTPPPGYGPLYGPLSTPSPVFPSTRGLSNAGTAASGTRLLVRVTGVAPGVQITVPVQLQLKKVVSGVESVSGAAVLTSAALDGSGAFARIAGDAQGNAGLTVTGGAAVAVYEVLFADPFNTESVTIPFTYTGATSPSFSFTAALAPVSALGTATDTAPPRFFAPSGLQLYSDLAISLTHSGTFRRGQGGAQFELVVSSLGPLSSGGTVTVGATLPTGLTAFSMSGSGWTCDTSTLTCTRSDALAAGSTYPAIILAVNVAANAPGSFTASGSVSVSGDGQGANNSASDTATLSSAVPVTITTLPVGLTFSVDGTSYNSPAQFFWLPGDSHTVSAAVSQTLNSRTWTFNNWSDSGALSHSIVVPANGGTYTASFLTNQLTAGSDFDGDGRADLVVYDPFAGHEYTGISDSAGSFAFRHSYFTPNFDTIRTGDWNGDGKTDLVVYNSVNALGYLGLNDGTGNLNFRSLFWSPGFNRVAAGDLNGDGRTDFVLHRTSDGTTYTALSNGDGTFTYRYMLVTIGYTNMLLADFNGDGRQDVLFYRATDGLAHLGLSSGTGTFSFTPAGLLAGYTHLVAANLDGDQNADLVLYAAGSGIGDVAISGGGGFTIQRNAWSPGFTTVALFDYNGDGRADLALYNKNNGLGYLGTNTGNGTFTFTSLFWGFGMDVVATSDFNGDGATDVVIFNAQNGTSYTGLSTGIPSNPFNYRYGYWGIGRMVIP